MPYNVILTVSAGSVSGIQAYVGRDVLTTTIGTIDAWCIDVLHDISLGNNSYSYDLGPFPPSITATQAREIAGLMVLGNTFLDDPSTSDKNNVSAAIQLAIWQVEYGNLVYTGGNSTLDGLYATYLGEAPNLSGNGEALIALDGQQGLATVPEPMSLALFGTALLGLQIARRKFNG
jgi:hypothetical protein